jgi:hypothetical protein
MEPIVCPKCGTELSEGSTTCYHCGAMYDMEDGEWEEVDNEDRRDLDSEPLDKFAAYTIFDYLSTFALLYGWQATSEIWENTDGFVKNVEKELSDYRPRVRGMTYKDRTIQILVRALRAHPDPDEITTAIKKQEYEAIYNTEPVPILLDPVEQTDLRNDLSESLSMRTDWLQQQAEEQRKFASESEHLEAIYDKREDGD